MTTSNVWSLSFVVVALTASAVGYADFKFSLAPKAIQPGERATLTLSLPEKELVRPQGVSEEDLFPEADDEWLVKNENLELLDQDYRKENGVYVWKYQFTSYSVGEISIPPISVKMGPQTFSSELATLQVQAARLEPPTELRPDAEGVSAPWRILFWMTLLVLAALMALAYRYRALILKKLPRPKTRPEPLLPPEKPREWLRKQLLVLRARIDARPEDSHSPDAWSAILREFVSRQSGLPVCAWTTPEMRQRLASDPQLARLCGLMDECDRFKFSPERGNPQSAPPSKQTLHWIEESERVFL